MADRAPALAARRPVLCRLSIRAEHARQRGDGVRFVRKTSETGHSSVLNRDGIRWRRRRGGDETAVERIDEQWNVRVVSIEGG